MAVARGFCDQENAELTVLVLLDNEIGKLRSARDEIFEMVQPINDLLLRIAQRERDCVDKRHRLTTETHDREQREQTVQRLVELESRLKQAHRENVELRQSLDEAAERSEAQAQKIAELENRLTAAERHATEAGALRSPKTADGWIELEKRLNDTTALWNTAKRELSESRQCLSEVQERLAVTEQVTAATQRRALRDSDISEEQQLELAPQHQATQNAGWLFVPTENCNDHGKSETYRPTTFPLMRFNRGSLHHSKFLIQIIHPPLSATFI